MALGAKIKELREARHWTQLDLARKSSLTRSHISSIENNKIPNPEVRAILSLPKPIRSKRDKPEEIANIIRRLKEGALEVAGGVLIPLEEMGFCGFWPKLDQYSKQTISKLENFYKKRPGEFWESDLLITWLFNLP